MENIAVLVKIIFYFCFLFWVVAHGFFFLVVENTWLYKTEFANWNLYFLDRFWSPFSDGETFFSMLSPFSGYYGSFSEVSSMQSVLVFWIHYFLHLIGIASMFFAWFAPVVFLRKFFKRGLA